MRIVIILLMFLLNSCGELNTITIENDNEIEYISTKEYRCINSSVGPICKNW